MIQNDPRGLRAIALECAFFALLIAACGAHHVLGWYLWEDQAWAQYMAWGMFHHMRLYVDTVDMNWPGIVLIHAVAYLIAGTAPWGLRAIDLLCQFGLLAGTSYVFAAWGVSRPMRVFLGCAYLLTYLSTGWWWTAQRESFNWPLWVIGTLPWMMHLGPRDSFRPAFGRFAWFIFGMVTGLSLWIKPTPALALVLVIAMALLLCGAQQRTILIRGGIFFGMGILAISAGFLLWLIATGSLGGFAKWGIVYAFGAHLKSAWPWPDRFRMTIRTALSPVYRPAALGLAFVGLVVVVVNERYRKTLLTSWRVPFVTAVMLVAATAFTALVQGKTQCVYHFIPMRWSFVLLAGVVWAAVPLGAVIQRCIYGASVGIAAITIFSLHPAGPTIGTAASVTVRQMLGPEDQIVMWGFSTTLLANTEHRTPFPIVGGSSIYNATLPGNPYRREILDELNVALRNPAVKLLLVEQAAGYAMNRVAESPAKIVDGDPVVSATVREQYRALPASTVGGFDVYERVGGAAKAR